MGPYCKYCDQRCFQPDPYGLARVHGAPVILATCTKGMEHDKKAVGYNILEARAYAEGPRPATKLLRADGTLDIEAGLAEILTSSGEPTPIRTRELRQDLARAFCESCGWGQTERPDREVMEQVVAHLAEPDNHEHRVNVTAETKVEVTWVEPEGGR